MVHKKDKQSYIVYGNKSWNLIIFKEVVSKYPGEWHFFQKMDLNDIDEVNPRYIFFLHWSCKVPDSVIKKYECVCFHMTDVPYGRGGSPLQNLIVRGHSKTKLTALRMTNDFDAGPVYVKKNLCLHGNAEEIYIRATYLAAKMIKTIITKEPKPVLQTGKVVIFERREPKDSKIPELTSIQALYDFIRMLDAEGYPKAFFMSKNFRFEFRRAALYNGRILADVVITPLKGS
jgi:methionyl-tRNA formyltransferase